MKSTQIDNVVKIVGRFSISILMIPLSVFCFVSPAEARLDQNCTVSVLNRNVQANADGTWVLPNIPANFGRVRARATCVQSGVTTYGQSDYFTIPANGSITLPPIEMGSASAIPTSVTLTAPAATLTSQGATLQLGVTAAYASGQSANISSSSTGTAYNISNTAIATVSPEGLVTAVRSGTVMVQAINEGAQGILMLRVAFANGVDSDGDGIPDEEEIRLGMNPNNPADALLDQDHDGLTDRDEYLRGTDPKLADSDGDGLSDGDEVRGTQGFVTNALLADTDGDGITDRTEIQTGSDPTNASSINLAAALTGIRVTPANFTLVVNSITGEASVQLTVTGTLLDGRTIDLTSTQRGTSYASSNLTSCNFGSPDGRVFASSVGACTITVSNGTFSATSAGAIQSFDPTALSYVAIPGYANDVVVSGDYAYIAAGSGGLKVVALSSDRRTPSVAASLSLSGNANSLMLAGNRAYIAGSSGLQVVDITNPIAPRLLGSFATSGTAMGVKVVGTTAFVAAGSSLQVVNVANPAAMIAVSSLSVGSTAWNLDVDPNRNLAIVAAGTAGIRIIDISNVAAPVQRGQLATGDARGVAMRGNYAYIADYNNSMRSVDTTNPITPSLLSSTPLNLGGRLQNIVLSGNFALGADVLFVNGVPIVDVSDPAVLRPRSILNFPARDDNGMGIAVDSSFVYLAADRSGLSRGGSSGDSRLYIGQFQPRIDLAGVSPTAVIASPTNGSEVFEGSQLTVSVNAEDDIAVAALRFTVDGQVAYTTTSAPYQYTFTVPNGVNSLMLGAEAVDLGGNTGSASDVFVSVVPDPLTVVTGRLVDASNNPLSGATVTAPGGRTGVTDADGLFSIVGVPTVLGDIFVNASYTASGGNLLTGTSTSIPPVRGGVTNVGTATLISAQFETNYGTYLSSSDDASYLRTLPFAFPFYGINYTSTYVGTNGYVTFNSGDSNYVENVLSFTSKPRISAFFDDLYGARSGGAVYVNDQLPGRFIVTHDRVGHYSYGGSNTIQIQLFQDGRIIFAFNGMTSLNTGAITGITPGPNAPFQQVDFSMNRNFDASAGAAIYEYFTTANLFDLDRGFVIFTPNGSGGYSVRTILPTSPAAASFISGGQ